MFWTETVCGLSVLVLPSFVVAKLNDGGCDWLTSTTWLLVLSGFGMGRCRCGRG